MSHYRKIDVRIWNDEKFVSLSPFGRLAFFMLLTHPMMTALGAMRGTPGGIVDELCSGEEGYREAYREGLQDVIGKGMAEYDPKASLIALPNFVRYNPPESPNVVKAWEKASDLLPEGDLKTLTIQRAVAFAEGMSKGFRQAIPECLIKTSPKAYPKTYPNQRAESRDIRYEEGKDSVGASTFQEQDQWIDRPQTEEEGRELLRHEGLNARWVEKLLPTLMNNNLTRSQVERVLITGGAA